jgi:hypothetical protein
LKNGFLGVKKMKNNSLKIALAGHMLVMSLLLIGCIFTSSNQSQKFTKIVHMPLMTLSTGSSFETKSHNGSINVHGSDVTDCNVTATIIGYASTVEDAEEVAEQTKLNFEQTGGGLVLKIDRPAHLMNRYVSVSLNVILPENVNLNLESNNGSIEIDNIKGDITASSHNGRIFVRNISGQTKLESHNGSVEAENISGDINFLSHNGRIKAEFSQSAAPDTNITMISHNGSIELTAPENYSARADISTHNGSINLGLHITVSGNFSKNQLIGIIGDGKGELKLETHNGSINIR